GELIALLNPINHANSNAALHRYKVEPYVVAADVYGVPPHVGRGGGTWYTGSAGWVYRVALECLLGCKFQGSALVLVPCIPSAWPGFEMHLRHGTAQYDIAVENPARVNKGIARAELDGAQVSVNPLRIALAYDGASHRLRVVLG